MEAADMDLAAHRAREGSRAITGQITHKSAGVYRRRHALMAVRGDGTRDLTVESEVGDDGELYVLADADAVARLDLSPEGLEFLIEQLPEHDEFTRRLCYMRDLARLRHWDRAVRG